MINIKQINILVIFSITMSATLIVPNKYTIICSVLINFLYLLYIFKSEIKRFDFNHCVTDEFIHITSRYLYYTIILQGSLNFVTMHLLKLPQPQINQEYIFPITSLLAVIFQPIIEEAVYRKIIFKEIETRFGFWIGAIISSLLFTLGHFNIAAWAGYFAVGILWCYFYKRTNNIATTITIHIMTNLLFYIVNSLK